MAWWLLGRVKRHTNKPKRMPIYFSTPLSTSWEFGKQSVLIRTKWIWWLITVAERSHQSQMLCGGCADVFKTQFSPKTLSQTAKRPTTAAKGFQGTGYGACVWLPLCACVVSVSKLQDLMPWLSQALEERGLQCSPIQFDVSLATTMMPVCTQKSFIHTLWALAFTHPAPLARNTEL